MSASRLVTRGHKKLLTTEEKSANKRAGEKRWRINNPEKVAAQNARKAAESVAHRGEKRAYDKKYNREHATERANYERYRRYGLTEAAFVALVVRFGDRCGICLMTFVPGGRSKLSRHIDHNHLTGEIRGFLCSEHNIGIGKFGDDPALLARAISYLSCAARATDKAESSGNFIGWQQYRKQLPGEAVFGGG